MTKAIDWGLTNETLEVLLDTAEGNAKTEWEQQFTKDMQARFTNWGEGTFMSAKQLEILYKIADPEGKIYKPESIRLVDIPDDCGFFDPGYYDE